MVVVVVTVTAITIAMEGKPENRDNTQSLVTAPTRGIVNWRVLTPGGREWWLSWWKTPSASTLSWNVS